MRTLLALFVIIISQTASAKGCIAKVNGTKACTEFGYIRGTDVETMEPICAGEMKGKWVASCPKGFRGCRLHIPGLMTTTTYYLENTYSKKVVTLACAKAKEVAEAPATVTYVEN